MWLAGMCVCYACVPFCVVVMHQSGACVKHDATSCHCALLNHTRNECARPHGFTPSGRHCSASHASYQPRAESLVVMRVYDCDVRKDIIFIFLWRFLNACSTGNIQQLQIVLSCASASLHNLFACMCLCCGTVLCCCTCRPSVQAWLGAGGCVLWGVAPCFSLQ